MIAEFQLQVPQEIERRLGRCRASVRDAIRERLREIAVGAGKGRSRTNPTQPREPPLRFYVYEGYRVFYQVDPETRRVVVLDLDVAVS